MLTNVPITDFQLNQEDFKINGKHLNPFNSRISDKIQFIYRSFYEI